MGFCTVGQYIRSQYHLLFKEIKDKVGLPKDQRTIKIALRKPSASLLDNFCFWLPVTLYMEILSCRGSPVSQI